MSLYNLLFGINPNGPVLLAVLGLNPQDIPRLRDCYLSGDSIVVYTRTGGGNRDYYESEEKCRSNYPEEFIADQEREPYSGPWNETLRANEHFLRDEDDDYDSTYAKFYFRFPDKYADELKALATSDSTPDPSERWKALLDSLQPRSAEPVAGEN